jgi:hypothetical protein
MPRHARITILLTLAVTFLSVPTASAGTFTVHSCTTPTGRWTGAEGWTASASAPTLGRDNGSATGCLPSSSPLSLQFGTTGLPVAPGSWVRWTFNAASNTTITGASMRRSFHLGWPTVPGSADRPYASHVWHGVDENDLVDFQAPLQRGDTVTQNNPELIEQLGVSWEAVHVSLRCWGLVGSLDCASFPAQVAIPRATFQLTDSHAPVGVVTGGSLAGADPIRGVGSLAFHASDAGGGVYRSILTVDGDEVARQVVDADGGRCADVEPANGDAYEFAAPRPCPLDADGQVQLGTAGLPDGAHAVRLSVEDAAGNVDVVFDDTVTTHNAPIATGTPSLGGTAKVGAQLSAGTGQWDGAPTGFGYRWLRCDADGAHCSGIAGADGATYAPTSADAYRRLRVEVTAENASGSASALSASSARVADAVGNTTAPAGGSAPALGGIAGLANPLGNLAGHVGNGTNANGGARLTIAFRLAAGRTALRVRSPRARRWVVVGRLLAGDGRGIGGARLSVAWKTMGSHWVARGAVRTRADGRFEYVLPAGPSRQVKLAYFAFSDSRGFVTSNVVREDVLAPLTLRADRRHVTGERVVRLSGRVGGGSIPRAGLLVTLQGYQAGWAER